MDVVAQRGEGIYLIAVSKEQGFVLNLEDPEAPKTSPLMIPDAFIKFGYWEDPELSDDQTAEVLSRARMIGPAPSAERPTVASDGEA